MKVLVTGSGGKFGPHVVRELENHGHEVVLFSRSQPSEEFQHLTWVQGDVNSYEDCKRAMNGGIDAVHHVAAKPGPTDHPHFTSNLSESEYDATFHLTMQTNIMGLYYLLHAAMKRDVGIFVMTGSNCVLGHGFRISARPFPIVSFPIDEDHPCDVEDSYSYSKLAGEQLLASYSKAYGMRTYALRSAGIRDEHQRREMAEHASPATGWDTWLWPWIGSEDLALAHRLLMEKAHVLDAHGVYFCNNDDTAALEPTITLIEKFRPDLVPAVQRLEGYESLLSNRKLKKEVGWVPTTSWRQYLKTE